MRERINKPRVFLSHARRDAAFVERVETDLRKCQIDPWRDLNEIRDGQPWMSAIFEDGIPTCDAILAYFTDNSLNSEMVAKEVDSAILRRLSDSKIAFLPYVDEDVTRQKLRVDIQTLQCRVWNEENYSEIFPSIVAEVWRSFVERNIENAVLTERNRRLELELELKRLNELRGEEIFSNQNEKEFQYIFEKLDYSVRTQISVGEDEVDDRGYPYWAEAGHIIADISVFSYLLELTEAGYFRFNGVFEPEIITNLITEYSPKNGLLNNSLREIPMQSIVQSNLVKFNLIDKIINHGTFTSISYHFNEKMNRFRFWVEYKGIKSQFPAFEYQDFIKKMSE